MFGGTFWETVTSEAELGVSGSKNQEHFRAGWTLEDTRSNPHSAQEAGTQRKGRAACWVVAEWGHLVSASTQRPISPLGPEAGQPRCERGLRAEGEWALVGSAWARGGLLSHRSPLSSVSSFSFVPRVVDLGFWVGTAYGCGDDGLRGDPLVPGP